MLFIAHKGVLLVLVRALPSVHYSKKSMMAWVGDYYSTRQSQVLYEAQDPCQSAIFHIALVWQFLNWFKAFLVNK